MTINQYHIALIEIDHYTELCKAKKGMNIAQKRFSTFVHF